MVPGAVAALTASPEATLAEPGGQVGASGSFFTLLVAPFMALLVIVVLALLLRWAFSHGSSVVARPPTAGAEDEYGMLVTVAAPATFIEAEAERSRLVAAGVRATLAPTTDGPRVLVFPRDLERATAILRDER